MEHVYKAKVTRWDGAVDDFEGFHFVDWAVDQYKAGAFNSGGNNPRSKLAGDWLNPNGDGRTFYVGKRRNGKILRIYEKGMQLGDSNSPWVRWEVELRKKDREIPWDVLRNPGGYVAGAYPVMEWLSVPACRISTFQNTVDISYEHLKHYLKQSYGSLINVMIEVEGSAEAVVEMLRKVGLPSRLRLPTPSDAVAKEQE